MKPEPRIEPDPKRTKLAEPKKEPKIEPHDPADEAPRLDREHRDDKALETEKRRKREKEERREKKREERRKEKSSKHEGMISRYMHSPYDSGRVVAPNNNQYSFGYYQYSFIRILS